ncbi:aldo/keto reductase [Lacticaseibacillus jixiensis]|uniref:aldo/keto reductase n=1 Tax=Lacticaseibacillus jixiensis TaxID=3231926 RepID=UPI0036F25A7C
MDYYYLADGQRVPQIGFGTGGLKGASGFAAIQSAIENGYRLIDTAYNYENEGTVGAAIRSSGVNRAQIKVLSKLAGRYYARRDALDTIKESLYRSGLDYFDVYLLHWPNPEDNRYVEAWGALIDAQRVGLVKSIGVSNFVPTFMSRLQNETGVLPVINEVALNPAINQSEVRAYDIAHHILTACWSPLGGRRSNYYQDPRFLAIADKYGKNVGQIILRWELQLGTLPVPKSTSARRQAENLQVFDFALTDDEMQLIRRVATPESAAPYPDPMRYQQF